MVPKEVTVGNSRKRSSERTKAEADNRELLRHKEIRDRQDEAAQQSRVLEQINGTTEPSRVDSQERMEQLRQDVFQRGRALLVQTLGQPDPVSGEWKIDSGSWFRGDHRVSFHRGIWAIQLSSSGPWICPGKDVVDTGAIASADVKKAVETLAELNRSLNTKEFTVGGKANVEYHDAPIIPTPLGVTVVHGNRAEFQLPSDDYLCAEVDPNNTRRVYQGDARHCIGTGRLTPGSNRCVLCLKPGQKEATIAVWYNKTAKLWGVYEKTEKDREKEIPYFYIKLVDQIDAASRGQ